jgi:hypothetical protein
MRNSLDSEFMTLPNTFKFKVVVGGRDLEVNFGWKMQNCPDFHVHLQNLTLIQK